MRRFAYIQANCPSVRVLRLSCSNALLPFLPQSLKELHFTGTPFASLNLVS